MLLDHQLHRKCFYTVKILFKILLFVSSQPVLCSLGHFSLPRSFRAIIQDTLSVFCFQLTALLLYTNYSLFCFILITPADKLRIIRVSLSSSHFCNNLKARKDSAAVIHSPASSIVLSEFIF